MAQKWRFLTCFTSSTVIVSQALCILGYLHATAGEGSRCVCGLFDLNKQPWEENEKTNKGGRDGGREG